MATPTVSENPEVQRHYLAQAALAASLSSALDEMWSLVDPLASVEAMDAFRAGVFALVEQFSTASVAMSSDYYAQVRRAAGVQGAFRPRLVETPPRSLVDAGIDYALRTQAEAAAIEAAIMERVHKTMEKAVLDAGRAQLVQAVEGDDRALGFRRVARPGACYWCLSLAVRASTRGTDGREHIGVYKTRASAGQLPAAAAEVNRYHNNCHCTVEPVFSTAENLPDWLLEMKQLYADSTLNSKRGESLNDFRRALGARRRGDEADPDAVVPLIRPAATGRDQLRDLVQRLADLGAA